MPDSPAPSPRDNEPPFARPGVTSRAPTEIDFASPRFLRAKAPVKRRAPAKVNLALSVGAPDPQGPHPGWHPLASYMTCLDLFDLVTVTPSDSTNYHIVWTPDAPKPTPIDWPLKNDLAVRAHRALEASISHRLPCSIVVEKKIPVGSGLGGGSSDAAATLLALRDAFTLPLDDSFLAAIGAKLGSDVPFFTDHHHRPAIVSGFGETVKRFATSETLEKTGDTLLLVIPPFGCETPAVYNAFDTLGPSGPPQHQRLSQFAADPMNPDLWFNDLQPAAERVEPRLRAVRLAADAASGLRFVLTGSGSTLIAPSRPAERQAVDRLRHALHHDTAHAGTLAGCQLLTARILS